MSGCLIPVIVEGLLEAGLVELGDPDESGMRLVAPTEAGQARYRVLCQLQRRKDPEMPLPIRAASPRSRPVTGQAGSAVDRGTVDPVE